MNGKIVYAKDYSLTGGTPSLGQLEGTLIVSDAGVFRLSALVYLDAERRVARLSDGSTLNLPEGLVEAIMDEFRALAQPHTQRMED